MTLPTEIAPADAPGSDDRCPTCRAEITASWLVCAHCGARLATTAALPDGTRLADRFLVRGVLGRGGFGITYEVDDERLQRRVAVKELFPDAAVRHGSVVLTPPHARTGFADAKERFLREARTLARFSHPGIVRVFEVFEEHNTAYLVLELVDGPSLADILGSRQSAMPESEVLDICRRVSGALIAVHEAGMLHRDLSPSNLVCTPSGRIVLIDFGLAKAFREDPTASMTRIVTPGYAPMEQYTGKGPFGPPTDVYGLSATMYRLLTAQTPVAAIDRSAGKPLPPPHRVNPDVSKAVSDAVMDGLELQPEHRPPTIESLLARLGLEAPALTRAVLLPPSEDRTRLETGGPRADRSPAAPLGKPAPAPMAFPRSPQAEAQPYPQPQQPYQQPQQAQPPAYAPQPVPQQPVFGAAQAPLPRPSAQPSYPPAAHGRPAYAGGGSPPVPIVGPGLGRRWKVTLPAAFAVVALTSAAPVLLTLILVLVAMPALATLGDLATHRWRRSAGHQGGWLDRRDPRAAMPLHAAKNVLVSVVRSIPPLLLLLSMVGIWYLMETLDLPYVVGEFWLRATGAATSLIILTTAAKPGRMHTNEGIDEVYHLLITPTGGFTQHAWVFWILAIALTAAGLFLTPEVWPLP